MDSLSHHDTDNTETEAEDRTQTVSEAVILVTVVTNVFILAILLTFEKEATRLLVIAAALGLLAQSALVLTLAKKLRRDFLPILGLTALTIFGIVLAGYYAIISF